MIWYEVTAWCEEGPFKLMTDSYEEAVDWAAAQEKQFGVRKSEVEEHES